MFSKPSMITRVSVGKTLAAAIVLLGWLLFSDMLSTLPVQLQFGFALWYILIGAIVGAFGMLGSLPVINRTMPWWIRGPWIGAWLNLILSLFIWNDLVMYQSSIFGAGSILASPIFFILEGALFGFFVDFLCTRIGGEAD